MNLLRLFPAVQQFQVKNGAINTDGRLYVYFNGTDDLADCFDVDGSRIAQPVILDNNGRAPGLFVDADKVYRLEVQDRYGNLLFTVRNMVPTGGGAGSALGKEYEVVSLDGSVAVDKSVDAGVTTFNLSINPDDADSSVIVARSDTMTEDGTFQFTEEPIAESGSMLDIIDDQISAKVGWYHFDATVEVAYAGTSINQETPVVVTGPNSVEHLSYDMSYAHTEYITVEGDYEIQNNWTPLSFAIQGVTDGMTAKVVNASVHEIIKEVGGGGGFVQENADWEATSGVAEILNKPDLSVYATNAALTYGLAGKQDVIDDLDTIRSGASLGTTSVQPAEFNAALAQKQDTISDLAQIRSGAQAGASAVQHGDLSTVATTGDYDDLINKPTINNVPPVTSSDNDKVLKASYSGGVGSYSWQTEQGGGDVHPYLSLERLREYLYRVTFDSLVEDNGDEGNIVSGACSSYVMDGKLYRNLDWSYDNTASFIVRCKDFVGVSFITGLDDGNLDDDKIAQLPYRVVDGCNNSSIRVSTHVLYNDWEWTGTGDRTYALTNLPFIVLSRVKSMASIHTDLAGVLDNVYAPAGLQATGYLIQILVTDGTTTYAILPPESAGMPYVLQDISSLPKLTNFRWINKRAIGGEFDDEDLQERPTGIERWDMIPCPLEELRFTKCYEIGDRLSEFIGIDRTTKESSITELNAIYERAHAAYLTRTRDGETWQTMHSVVYGENGIEHLWIQENWADDIVDTPALAKVATTGDYNDLLNKPNLSVYATTEAMNAALATKQDTIDDLATIRSGASAGASAVQPSTMSAALAEKQDVIGDLSTIRSGAQLGATAVQPADLSSYATDAELTAGLATKQDTINDLATIRSGAASGATALQPGALDSYATKVELNTGLSGKQDTINDLSTIRSGAAAGSTAVQPADLAPVATTGDYDDLSNKPSIPTKTSDITNDSGFVTSADVPVKDVQVEGVSVVNAQGIAEISIPATGVLDVKVDGTSVVNAQGTAEIDLSGYATTQALTNGLAAKQDVISDLSTIRSGATAGASAVQPGDLATVATTGSYNDLADKPSIPAAQVNSDWNSTSGVSQILNKPTLAAVATTGDYDDLVNKPSIPAAQVNSDWNAVSGVSEILNKPTIPSATSDLTNDSGFITSADVPVKDVEVDGASVVNAQGVAEITMPDLSTYAKKTEVADGLATKQDIINDLATIRSGAASGATALQPGDLTGYATEQYVDTGLASKQDVLTAGENITIENNVISATGGETVTLTSSDGSITTENNDLTFTNSRIVDEPREFTSEKSDLYAVYYAYISNGSRYTTLEPNILYYADVQHTVFPAGSVVGIVKTGINYEVARLVLYYNDEPTGDFLEFVPGQPYPTGITVNSPFNGFKWTGNNWWVFAGLHVTWTEQVVHNDIYAETTDVNTALATKQDVLTAGTGISISGNTISSTVQSATITTDQFAGKTDKVVGVGSANLHMHYTPTEVSESTTRHYDWTPASYVFREWSPVVNVTNMASITVPSTVFAAELILSFDGMRFPWGAPSDGDELVFTVRRNGQAQSRLRTVYRSATGAFDEIQYNFLGDGATYTLNFLSADQPRLLYSLSLDGTMQITGGYDMEVTETRTVCNVPDYTLDGDDKVTAIDGHEIAGGSEQVQADWAEDDSAEPSFIQNKPTIPSGEQLVPTATSADADKVLTVDSQGTPAWASAQAPITAGNGIDITNNVVSVDTSVVATKTDLAGKEDAFDVGTGLEMDTSGATPTLQVEAPVDIVAGPGIVIDNPDGNTLRVSVAQAEETVLWSGDTQPIRTTSITINLSETVMNFEFIRFEGLNSYAGITDALKFANTTPANSEMCFGNNLTISNGTVIVEAAYATVSGSSLTLIGAGRGQTNTSGQMSFRTDRGPTLYKVVGIHRIAGGN